MALNTDDFQPSNEAQQAAQQSATMSGFTNTNRAEKPTTRFSFTQGTGFEDMGEVHTGASAVTAMKKIFEERYKDTRHGNNIRVLPLLRESYGQRFRYSALVVALANPDRQNGALNVAYHIVLVEASNPVKPDPYIVNNGNVGQQVNLPRFAFDGIDLEFVKAARELVEKSFTATNTDASIKKMHILYANAEVAQDHYKPDDVEGIGGLAVNALMAVVSTIRRLTNPIKFNLAETETTPFTVEFTFRDGSVTDLDGAPVRSDVIVKNTARAQARRQGFGLNGLEGGTPVSTSSLYIDLMYTQRGNNAMTLLNQPKPVEPCFVPRAILTNSMNYQGYSLEMSLFEKYIAFGIFESGAYKKSLINKQVKKGDLYDMTEIGATNVLANISNDATTFGPIYGTRDANVTDVYRNTLLNTILQPVNLLSIDCQMAGPSSWQTNIFQQAADSGKEGQQAREALIVAAMNLTNGEFAKFFPDNGPVVAYREIIPMGYWMDGESMKRDLREFDTLAILNRYGNDSPEMIAKWIHAQSDTKRDESQRLSDMVAVINDASGYRAVHTGRVVRVTIHPLFMHALQQGIKQHSHTFNLGDVYTDAGASNLRGAQFLNWSQLAANPSMQVGGYNKAGLDSMVGNGVFSNMFSL